MLTCNEFIIILKLGNKYLKLSQLEFLIQKIQIDIPIERKAL